MKIVDLNRSLMACPSQWEGTLEDGRSIYIRYRGGQFSARVGYKGDPWSAVMGDEVVGKKLGDDLDGYLDDADLLEALGEGWELPEIVHGASKLKMSDKGFKSALATFRLKEQQGTVDPKMDIPKNAVFITDDLVKIAEARLQGRKAFTPQQMMEHLTKNQKESSGF